MLKTRMFHSQTIQVCVIQEVQDLIWEEIETVNSKFEGGDY